MDKNIADLISERVRVRKEAQEEMSKAVREIKERLERRVKQLNQQIDETYKNINRRMCLNLTCQKSLFGTKRYKYCSPECNKEDANRIYIPITKSNYEKKEYAKKH